MEPQRLALDELLREAAETRCREAAVAVALQELLERIREVSRAVEEWVTRVTGGEG
jgi:hypothetical protein